MAGRVSVRFAKAERALLNKQFRAAGFPTLSGYIRTKLGFDPDGGIDPITEYEEIDTDMVLSRLLEVRDHLDNQGSLLRQIARHQGIRIEHLDRPRVTIPAEPDADGNVDIPAEPRPVRGLPVGFRT